MLHQQDIRFTVSKIEHKGFRFLITDRPSDKTIHGYIQELKKHEVTALVRVCESSYKIDKFSDEGIEVFDLSYHDGTYPSKEIIDEWFDILKRKISVNPNACVAVHCIAGLGRAPVMVALALMELGIKYEEAVDMIRKKRRGAINTKQLSFLEKYRPKSRLRMKKSHANSCSLQ